MISTFVNTDALAEARYSGNDPQFAPEPNENEDYIEDLISLRDDLKGCRDLIAHIKKLHRKRELNSVDRLIYEAIDDLEQLIDGGI